MILTNLAHAIVKLGATDQERADVLGVSRRTVVSYKRGDLPRIVLALAERPELVQALVVDTQQHKLNEFSLTKAYSIKEQDDCIIIKIH